MIINYLLEQCKWTPYGIECPNVNVALKLHKFLREAILDRHLYVCKAVGFELRSPHKLRNHMGTYIARHQQIGESYPELMVNLSDKLFLSNISDVVRSVAKNGVNTVHDLKLYHNRDIEVPCLYTNETYCTAIDKDVLFNVHLAYDCGYRHSSVNSALLSDTFFPCCTDFYAGDFFKVLPPDFSSSTVRINYYHGATPDTLRMLFSYWRDAYNTNSIRKEEMEWLQSFTHLISQTM